MQIQKEYQLTSDKKKSLQHHKMHNPILEANNALEIKEFAQKQGMQTLYLSALEKLKQGEISLLEMKRIIKV